MTFDLHPDVAMLKRHLVEQTDSDESQQIDEHLGQCESCQQELTRLAADQSWWDAISDCLTDRRSVDVRHLDEQDEDRRVADMAASSAQLWSVEYQQVQKLLAPTDDPQMIGRLGGYEVNGIVGAGATAVVLKAFDTALNRSVAIKLMRPTLAASPIARQRFAREARAAASIVHENVIEIYGVSEVDALPYLVMPYVRGESLARRIERSWPLPVDAILHIACQVADGLQAAHAKGVIHRDVKPSNILLGDGIERLKLTDFGLARAVNDVGLTRSGTLAGTPEFMSPEQAGGKELDHQSDLFSLGSVVYCMCTGRPPFTSDSCYGVLRRIIDDPPQSMIHFNPDLPFYLVRLVERLMAKDPSVRYADAGDVANDLRHCLRYRENTSIQLPSYLRPAAPIRRYWPIAIFVGILFLCLFGILVATPQQDRSESPSARPASGTDNETVVASLDSHRDAWDDEIGQSILEVQEQFIEFEKQIRIPDSP